VLAHRAEVIAEVAFARGLDARQNSHGRSLPARPIRVTPEKSAGDRARRQPILASTRIEDWAAKGDGSRCALAMSAAGSGARTRARAMGYGSGKGAPTSAPKPALCGRDRSRGARDDPGKPVLRAAARKPAYSTRYNPRRA
jgi:hypothetical protein